MRIRLAVALAAIGLLGATAGQAADGEGKFELTPYGAYRFGGSFDLESSEAGYELADSPSFGVIFNIRQHANTQWEILYSSQQTDASFSDATINAVLLDVSQQTLQGGGTYQGEGEAVRPYLAVTLGGTHIQTSVGGASRSDTFWSGSIGLGLQIRPTERIGIRLEARAYGTLMDSDTDLFCQTGPNQNICAVRIDGTLMSQVETLAGVVFRF
jgi:hypothetical protein